MPERIGWIIARTDDDGFMKLLRILGRKLVPRHEDTRHLDHERHWFEVIDPIRDFCRCGGW